MPDTMNEATEGAGIVNSFGKLGDDVRDAANGVSNPEDFAMDGVSLALDALGLIENPLSGLLSAGIGWLIEHLDFLKEPLDDLAGDPKAITNVAITWREDVKGEVERIAQEFQQAVERDTANWRGEAGDRYRKAGDALAKQVDSLGPAADGVASAVQGSGVLVATVRALIRDIIADVVAEIVIAAATALATSWCTLGGSIAAFTGWAVARGAMTAGKIAGKISKLLTKLANILSKFSKLKGAVRAIGKAAKKFGDQAKTLGQTASRNMRTARQFENIARESASAAGRAAAEAAPRAARDAAAELPQNAAKETAENTVNVDDDYRDAKADRAEQPSSNR